MSAIFLPQQILLFEKYLQKREKGFSPWNLFEQHGFPQSINEGWGKRGAPDPTVIELNGHGLAEEKLKESKLFYNYFIFQKYI